MKLKEIMIAALSIILLAGQYSCTSETRGPAPTLAEAMEAEYAGIYDSPVRLDGGRFEGEPFAEGGAVRPTVELLGDLFMTGDIGMDGTDESAVFLIENSGGTGSFLYLALLERRGGAVRNTGTLMIGDRTQVRDFQIEAGRMIVDVIQHDPEDGMCCPTRKTRRTWKLVENDIVEEEPILSGNISTADLQGIEWVLKMIDSDDVISGDTPVTLLLSDGRISGVSGCNRYFADIEESSPGEIRIGMAGSTRMACPEEVMDVEKRYLDALQGRVRYSFLSGKLALTCRAGDGPVTLVFTRGE